MAQNDNFLRPYLFISAVLFSSLISQPLSAELQKIKEKPDNPQKSITLICETQTKVEPDIGIVTLYFTGYGWSVEKAGKKLDKIIKDFQDQLAKEKTVPAQMEIGEIKLKPSYQFNRDLKTHVPSDFLVTRKVALQFEDLNTIVKMMDISISMGSFILESARLTVKDKPGLEQKAFKEALEEGRKKAEQIARSLDATLGDILNVEEISYELKEVNLIQDTLFAEKAASVLNLTQEQQKTQNETGTLKEENENLDYNDQVEARSKIKITYSLR